MPSTFVRDVLLPVVRVLVRGRGVDDDVRRDRPRRPRDDVLVGDRALDYEQLRVRGQVVAPAGRVVVDDDDVVAPLEQAVGKVRPDEARAAGDQNLSCGDLFSFVEPFAEALGLVVERLLPELEAQQAPDPAAVAMLGGETGQHLAVVDERRGCARRPTRACRRTKSRTSLGPVSHSCSGTGKPILSLRVDDRVGQLAAERVRAGRASSCRP